VILKPGFAAHRLDNFYLTARDNLCAGDEIWSAPTVPARLAASAREDRRANSMARLFPLDGGEDEGVWWYSLLLYDLSETRCLLTPAHLSPPALSTHGYVVSRYGVACADGAAASSCVEAFSESAPLQIKTEESHTGRVGDIRLHSIAPVLPGGWALLGEQSKYVAVSPQRLVVGHTTSSNSAAAGSDSLSPGELLHGDDNFAFGVLGEPGESVAVAVLIPPKAANATQNDAAAAVMNGKVSVVKLKVGAAGRSEVECSAAAGCHVKSSSSIFGRDIKTDDSASASLTHQTTLPDISFDTANWTFPSGVVVKHGANGTTLCITGDPETYIRAVVTVPKPAEAGGFYFIAETWLHAISPGSLEFYSPKMKVSGAERMSSDHIAQNLQMSLDSVWIPAALLVPPSKFAADSHLIFELSIQQTAGEFCARSPRLAKTVPAPSYQYPFPPPASNVVALTIRTTRRSPVPGNLLSANSQLTSLERFGRGYRPGPPRGV
jgi:hypothetical protein